MPCKLLIVEPQENFTKRPIIMKKMLFLAFIAICLTACSGERPRQESELPIIDVIGSMGNFQRIYMSEFFSSIELIPLETSADFLLDMGTGGYLHAPRVLINDNVIVMRGDNRRRLFAFDRFTGKFRNQIARQGQGPGELIALGSFFFNADRTTIFVNDIFGRKILEYDFNGGYIRSVPRPEEVSALYYARNNLFIGSPHYTGDNKYKHLLVDANGDIIQRFSNHIFFNRQGRWASSGSHPSMPVRMDNRLYFACSPLNDTVFVFENSNLRPAYVFDFGRSLPLAYLTTPPPNNIHYPNFRIAPGSFVATPHFFFYNVHVPRTRPGKRQRVRSFGGGQYSRRIFGIYDISRNRNILLDTDQHLQQGIINDINGGLSFIPQFYAGNGEVVGVWNPEDMLEVLTEEYFATQTIKDPEAHQRLRAILRNLEFDDNPVIVVARLKE